jgi:diguanylate cyclase (GGDEF)-like protein/PAS domain S-box-containing protein
VRANFSIPKIGDSPLASVVKVGLVILVTELGIMLAIGGVFLPLFGGRVPAYFWEFLDPVLLTAIVAPVLHLWVLRPMKAQQLRLEQQKDELRIAAVAFESQNGMMITDPQGQILRVNAAFTRLTGFSADETVGRKPAMLKSERQDQLFYRRLWDSLREKGYWQGEIWNRRKNGQIYAEMLAITAIATPTRGVTHYVGSYTDITEDKEAEAEIHRLAYYDVLTKLPNRRLLQDRLGQALAATARTGFYGAIFFIDVDNFKSLNDTRGHDVGDLLLVQVAKRLRAVVREADTVARQGGDEFVVLLEDLSTDVHEAVTLASQIGEKLREGMVQVFDLIGYEYHCRLSVGVSLFGQGDTVEDLMKHADLALYQAKNSGRNTLRFFDPAMQAELDLRAALESELRLALQSRQLLLHYQPQVNDAGQVIGAEALLRWQHPQRGLVPPDEFIPLAEDTGLILLMGHWVLESACALLKSWESDVRMASLQLAVNVSSRQFRQSDFVAQVERALIDSSLNPARLKLELTESLVLEDVEDTIGKMQAIRRYGVKFSMDDFGTGHSSLSYLAQLPLDQLKIDRSFVRNLPGKKNDETIARAIITMGAGMDMEVIAEGVETHEQREFLQLHGCHAFQGFLFSRPLPLEDFVKFVQRI